MTLNEKLEVMHILQTRHNRARTEKDKSRAEGMLDGFMLACSLHEGDLDRLRAMRIAELQFQGKAQ